MTRKNGNYIFCRAKTKNKVTPAKAGMTTLWVVSRAYYTEYIIAGNISIARCRPLSFNFKLTHHFLTNTIQSGQDGETMKTLLTLDTCIFENYNMNTDTMLRHLEPAIKADVEFILSEIVFLELKSHYETTYRVVSRTLDSAHKKLQSFTTNQNIFNQIQNLQTSLQNEKASDNELGRFIKETKSKIIQYQNITLNEVVDAYFKMDAPFRPGKKKAEFPDAIALYSLDKWATAGGRKITAISCDNDWNVFAEKYPERWTCNKTIDLAMKRLRYNIRR